MRRSLAMSVFVTTLEMSVEEAPSAVPWHEAGVPVEPKVPSTVPVDARRTSKYMQPVVPPFDWKSSRKVAPATDTFGGSGELKSRSTYRVDWNVVVHAEVV